MQSESTDLLRRYARDRSEAAFRELVQQHSGVVYGTALRQIGGDRAAAQDVMQEVFTLLVRKAPGLGDVVLSAWLYRQTCRRAANHLRTESRRRKRELLAFETMSSSSPASGDDSQHKHDQLLATEIDRALLTLSSPDRDALFLRFFESRNFRRVGETLGIGEEAARKRVTRALSKLTLSLKRRGILVTAATSLGSTMTGMAATQSPAAVVSRVTAQALKAAPAAGNLTSLVKPFFAGLLATSVVGGTLALTGRSGTAGSSGTSVASNSNPAGDLRAPSPADAGSAFDQLIASIKRLQSAPAHALTGMRFDALLESLPVDQIPAFIAFADSKLTSGEKKSCYERLILQWMKTDAPAAMSYAVNEKLPDKLEDGRNLATKLFTAWAAQNSEDA